MKINQKIASVYALVLSLLFASCGVNSNLMFKIPKGSSGSGDTSHSDQKYYKLYQQDSIPMFTREDYRISRDDKFTFTLSTNDGQRILEGLSGVGGASGLNGVSTTSTTQNNQQQLEYVVRSDNNVTLPVIGDINLVGKTIKQAEDTLKQLFSKHYQNPFVQIRVTNQRVIVFPGDGGEAKVVILKNNNTTLMEVLAEAGGITERGKANSVKLMRSLNGKREIYPIDLSKIEGLVYADMIVQANDYIYIEPNPRLGREALAQVTPFLAIITSLGFIVTILNTLK